MNADDFEAIFQPLSENYSGPTRLTDKYIGFSVLRNYPENQHFKPAKTSDGLTDTVALLHVLIDPELPRSEYGTPVRIRVSKFSKYLATHFDYDDQDPLSPNEESVRLSKAGPQPVDGMIVGQFFVNEDTRKLSSRSGAAFTPLELLDHAFDQHVRTTKPLHPEQLKLKLGKIQGIYYSKIALAARFLLTRLLGRELIPDKEMNYLFTGYPREDVRKLSLESISIFDYLVPKPVAVLFCLLVVVFFFGFHVSGGSSGYLKAISENGVIAAAHGLLALWLLNDVVPEFVRCILNLAIVRGGKFANFRIDKFL